MQKPRDSFANHLPANLQAQKPHRHPWDNHHSSGSDTAAEEGDLAVMDVALRPLLSSTATTATPSSTPPGHSSSTARLTRPIGTTAFNNYRQHLKKRGPYEVHCEVLDNRQGKIIVDGALTIYCGQLQSTNGMIAATGPIHIVCHEFCNSNGVVQSHIGTITITSRYALCNQQGQLLAQSDITLTHPHARFDNRQGSIISKGSLHITGDTLTNQGQITGETIGMTLKEQLINGPVGAIQAAKKLDVITSHDCRNEGQMQAGNQLTIQSHEFLNHNDGQLQAPQLKLTVDTYLRNRGTIEAKEMQLQAHTLSNFFKHDRPGAGQLRAENNLTLNDCYECYNEGEIHAGEQLSLHARTIHNHKDGKIQAPTMDLIGGTEKRDDGSLWSGGDVTNHGSIELRSGLMRARTVFNGSNGQVYADDLRIEATYFYNDSQKQEPEEVQERDTLLIARQRLTIGASRIIINRDQALLYSGGDLSIGKTLDDQQQAVGPAKVFNNLSATIDVQGNMQLNAEESNHEDIHFSTHLVEVSRSSGGHRCGSTYYGYDTIVSETRIATHEPAKLLVGGTLTINGEHFYNRQSQVIYGVKLQGSLQGLENIDGEGKRVTERRGHSVLDTRCGLFGLVHIHREGPYYTYKDHPISLGVVIEKQGSKPDSPGGQLARCTTDFTVSALQIIHRQIDGLAVRIMTLEELPILPTGGLFSVNTQNPQGPLIQTDPRLFSYPGRVDDFTSALIVNPSPQLPPWLGDTFYLQQLVRQQVQQLTGQRFLAGFRHDTEQCLALVLRGKELAQQPGFKIGKQLTAEQMQQLQQSVIWPIRQSFTLADGSQRWVVIPQLYAVITDTEVPSAVAMIHGHQMELQLSGKLINSGSLRTVNTLAVKAQRISNQGIIFGDRVQIQAKQDVDHQGKLLGAKQLLHVKAGVDFVAATRSHSSQVKDNRGHYSANQTVLGERSRMLVTEAGGQLLVEAGRDINLAAAQILNSGPDGSSQFISGRDINLQTVEVEQREHYQGAGEHYQGQGEQRDIGSQIKTAGNLRFQAKGQFTATAAQVASGIPINNALAALEAEGCASDSLNPVSSGRLQIQASSIALLPGRASRYREKSTQHTDKKLLNSTTRTDYQFQQQATILGCEFSGSHTELVATEGDLVVHGSKVASDHGTSLLAEQGNISITSAESHHQQITAHQEEKSGLFSEGGVSLTLGEQQHRQRQQLNGREQHSSAIGSRFGDVKIWAKQHYQQLGSHLVAPHGEVDASGATLEVKDTHHQQQLEQGSHSSSSGVTIGVTNPVISGFQTFEQLSSASEQTSDSRMQLLAGVTGGLATYNMAEAIDANPNQLGGINVSVTVGSRESHQHGQQTHATAHRSQIIGNQVRMTAREGDATLQGDIQAQQQLSLFAAKDLTVLASEDSSHQQSAQWSQSESVGVGIGTGSGGPSILFGASEGQGHSQGNRRHYQLAQIQGGQKVITQSGGNTRIQGEIRAEQITGNIAGNLTVESLQDIDQHRSQQHQFGVNLAVGSNSVSGSINANKNRARRDYASVQQQAGLKAGKQGFQLQVGGNTHLAGAVIASDPAAINEGRNQLKTGSSTQTAIENRDDYDASSVGLSVGFSKSTNQPQTGVGKNQLGQATAGPLQVPGSQLPSQHGLSATMPVVMTAGDSVSSITGCGISGVAQAVTITNPKQQRELTGQTPEQVKASLNGRVTSDQDGSNALKPIFNQQEIEAGFQIVGALTREVGTFLENRTRTVTEAQQALKQEQAKPLTQQDPQRLQQLQQTLQDNRHWGAGYLGQLVSEGSLKEGTPLHATLHGLIAATGAAACGQAALSSAAGAAASSLLTQLFSDSHPDETQGSHWVKSALNSALEP